MDVLGDTDVPWMKLAEKLGMKTLYADAEAPCQHLLQHYKVTTSHQPRPSDHMTCSSLTAVCVSQLAGGPVQVLIEALQDLGLSEGVRLLRHTEQQQEKHNTGNTRLRRRLLTHTRLHARTHSSALTPPHGHGRTQQFDVSLSNQKPQLTAASAASQWRTSRSRWPISEEQGLLNDWPPRSIHPLGSRTVQNFLSQFRCRQRSAASSHSEILKIPTGSSSV